MIDTVTYSGTCLNAFNTAEEVLVFLIKSRPPTPEIRLVHDRETERYSRQVITEPYDGWSSLDVPTIESFVVRARAEAQ